MRINRRIGYARVSKHDQNLKMQVDALLNYGCHKDEIFTDHISGAKAERPGLKKCMQELQKGDTLVVWRLDWLGRSMPHLVSTIEDLKKREISFKSLCDGALDTTTASGELILISFLLLPNLRGN
jgi:DNA invertase Pin-like site-specific DNA recombinase